MPKVIDPANDVRAPRTAKARQAAVKDRADLVEDLALLLQNTLSTKVSGVTFLAQVDLAGNYLHELRAYAASLKNAATVIQEAHADGPNEPLQALVDLSDLLVEGAGRTEQYLHAIRAFSIDLDSIRNEMTTQVVHLHQEL